MDKLTPEDIRVERLTKEHIISNFQSCEKELVNFLVEDASSNQENKISVTYLIFLKNTNELVGYVTLLNDRINLEGNLKETFRKKGVEYSSLPALKIGRLCVDDKFLRKGIGTMMIDFSIKVAFYIFRDYSGCRFIVLEAKKHENNNTLHFYKKLGFKQLKDRKKGTIPMYFDLINNFKV